ncbi:MAG: erythromycin biosynthesis sensory transduction protein eryC1 [Marinilabiliales bacterium]|nr:MAG: erythromycin biosynthesis sensory transduction protein eryC1 [Marinilabiliales bacterium]
MNNIPLLDLKAQYISIKSEIDKAINEVISNTDFINGKEVKRFEESFASIHESKYCTAVANGTNALHLAYEAIGIKAGDEVIVPSMTFIASSEPLRQLGAIPVFCDVSKESYNIDPKKIENLITKNTKAITVVHLHGNPADMDEIMAISKKYNLKVIEDCAQAHLAEYKGKKVGNFGEIACFSFYPGKNLGAFGDAGGITTNNPEYFHKIKVLANHGRAEKYTHEIEGYNYRMDTIQAAVLNVKLKYLEKWTNLRIEKAALYRSLLKETGILLPQMHDYKKHVFHVFAATTPKRDQIMQLLKENSIACGIHYPLPLHKQPAYQHLHHTDLSVSEMLAKQFISLPIYPELTDEDINKIAEIFKNSLSK